MRLPRTPYSVRETLGVARRMFGGPPKAGPPPWREPRTLVLRDARAPTRWIGFVGDVMPLMWRAARFSPAVVRFFEDCELVIGNLEGIVSDEAWLPFLQRHTRAIFSYLQLVAPADKWVLSVANNHAPDYGAAGFEQTLRALEETGIRWVGTDARPRIELFAGATLTAWTEWTNGKTSLVALRDPGAPTEPGLHLAYPHWGYEFERAPRRSQQRALPTGYDAVIGHHSHLPQEPEIIGGRLVAWSLGNFVTEVRLRTMGEGALLKLGIADGEAGPVAVAARAVPIRLDRSDRRVCAVEVAGD